MGLTLQRCVDADFPRIFALISISFGHEHEYIDAVFPAHDTPSGRAAGAERFLAMANGDPNTSFWKVVDDAIEPDGSGNEILAIAKWNVYRDNTVPEDAELGGGWWAVDTGEGHGDTEDERREYAATLFREYLIERRRAIRESGGNLVSLDILVTDPAHQKRGAGRMLVEYGTGVADELGVRAVVEASTYGRHLYELCGFRMEKLVIMDNLPQKWASRRKQEFFWMERPSKFEKEEEVESKARTTTTTTAAPAADGEVQRVTTREEKVGDVLVSEVREVSV